ncbi:FAD-binding oxidoreductase [Coralloluteibacterium stylophorae]|uniref:FAD-binding oxidoreductase n=1 Tax=Coralloluteibacterium stylophorae TaxID=1776034 RepID=A0A8J7VRR7_9GAMM|nr:FAD-binding oxidoreductase [Coralloluteibacterium stylophorae]MBS7456644.1 FAD-binding oxidoreductase [Coralloluteibacterium stylophorae]
MPNTDLAPAALDALRACTDAARVLTDPADLEHYGRDWTRQVAPAPSAIVLPASVAEVQAVVRWAIEHRVALVPSGGRTGLSGGAVAPGGEVVVALDRMNRLLAFDPIDRTLTVQAGMVTEAVQNAARERGLFYPVDFASKGSSQIGGNVGTNAGGIKVLRYGMTRDWVAGLKVVTGTGEVLELNRGLVKNATGYDLRHLFIGAEGTLGIVVEATLVLTEPPADPKVMVLALPDAAAIMRVFAAFRAQVALSAFEFFTDRALAHVLAHGAQRPFETEAPFYVVCEFDAVGAAETDALAAFEACAEEGLLLDGVIGQSQAQNADLWKLREGISESLAPHLPYKNDVSVRISAVPAFMAEAQALIAREYPDFEVVWFGHIGDGNLHINILKPEGLAHPAFVEECGRVTALLGEVIERHGGSISAEHGVGLLKKPYLHHTRGAAEIALMQGIRAVFDPHRILNPGKLVD